MPGFYIQEMLPSERCLLGETYTPDALDVLLGLLASIHVQRTAVLASRLSGVPYRLRATSR